MKINITKPILRIILSIFSICTLLIANAQVNTNAQLLLISPTDKEEIETLTPTLLWIAVLPQAMTNPGDGVVPQKTYRLLIVKLLENQNAIAGISSNVPVFSNSNISVQQLIYPTSAPKLVEGGRYGWQLQEFSNGQQVNQSEAWEFKILD